MVTQNIYSNGSDVGNYKYTKGMEYSLDGKNYIGEYHLRLGTPFTGPTPSQQSLELKRYYNNYSVYLYDKLKKFNKLVSVYKKPNPILFAPTEMDYTKGFASRFFLEKVIAVEKYPIEIDQKQATYYNTTQGVNGGLYQLVSINWKLVGFVNDTFNEKGLLIERSVSNHNRLEIEKASEKIPNIYYIIKSYIEFARFK